MRNPSLLGRRRPQFGKKAPLEASGNIACSTGNTKVRINQNINTVKSQNHKKIIENRKL